jgi:hypothetical protein
MFLIETPFCFGIYRSSLDPPILPREIIGPSQQLHRVGWLRYTAVLVAAKEEARRGSCDDEAISSATLQWGHGQHWLSFGTPGLLAYLARHIRRDLKR